MTMVHNGRSNDPDYGLSAIEQHNNVGEHFPTYDEDPKGLGIYVSRQQSTWQEVSLTQGQQDAFSTTYQDGFHNPPTPHSTSASEGTRMRSGRSAKRHDSPFSTTKSRVSKSPAPRRREKKSKMDKSKTPKLTQPLSILTKDMTAPVKDIAQWVNRSVEVRRQEAEKRNGYVTRPMNSFMLYRSAYADRTKQWCLQNNHQVVSSVSGESWPMEPAEVREQFNDWAKTERANHSAAHPDYKFSPSKSSSKKRKGEETDDDSGSIDFDDPDGEYRGPRGVRRRAQAQQQHELTYLPSNMPYDVTPYYDQQVTYDTASYPVHAGGRPLPSNVAYTPQYNAYAQLAVQAPIQYQQAAEAYEPRVSSPPSLGGYGLPGVTSEDIFAAPRADSPMQAYNQYAQQLYAYPNHRMPASYPIQSQLSLEHQQYLHAQAQATTGIDPALEAAISEAAAAASLHAGAAESHFDNAFNEYNAEYLYADQPNNVDATLAPSWSPMEALR